MDDLVGCPYCGEEIEIAIDEGGGLMQTYVEDCQVCCRPMQVLIAADEEGELRATVQRLDE